MKAMHLYPDVLYLVAGFHFHFDVAYSLNLLKNSEQSYYCVLQVTSDHRNILCMVMQLQWNLRIKDTLGQSFCPLYGRCPYIIGKSKMY